MGRFYLYTRAMEPSLVNNMIDYAHGISVVDAVYDRALQTAIHVVVEHGRAAIVDTGTSHAAPRVLAALASKGIAPAQVDYVVLTHIHLDHAGGAGQLMALCPNAVLTVHPRGARHMVDPSKLVAGTVAIYGEETTRRIYGEVLPVAAERIVETPEGAAISLAGREFSFLDAPGHARHHVVVRDGASGHIFAGDSFGLSYRELDQDGRQFVFPTCSPVQFDPAALHRTVERMLALGPPAIYVAHYGQVRDVPRLGADMRRLIDALVSIAVAAKKECGGPGSVRLESMRRSIAALLLEERERQGWRLPADEVLRVFALDIELNAQGLEVWLESR